MENLLKEYKQTAKTLYTSLQKFKNNQQNTIRYCILLAEYQHTCFVLRQIKNYCKARGLQ